ncbi:Vps51/Vps67-domain-containing protein [Xylariales sp. AK1849]|nr:Vps51/Vps67-domain-containing protein [Xylariales sp. AK1849]
MSTIASPREPPRRMPSSQNINASTPTSSARPSFDAPRSATGSPNPNTSNAFPSTPTPLSAAPKRNRAALREYYNLRNKAAAVTPSVEVTDPFGEHHEASEVPLSEMDKEGFEAEAFVRRSLAENGMEELLRLYTRTLGEIRALEAEKKALVYDNYSKLIAATETIRKMRANMDPLNPMASTLDPAVAQIYSQASAIRESLRQSIPQPDGSRKEAEEARQRKLRTKQLALEVLETPDRIRALVSEGRLEDARQAWKTPRKLLETWKDRGIGGDDVDACIRDGDAAVRGEPTRFHWRDDTSDDDE